MSDRSAVFEFGRYRSTQGRGAAIEFFDFATGKTTVLYTLDRPS